MFPITLIGSLPHKDIKEAVKYSVESDIIPFLPELPALGDAMLDYIKKPGKLSCLKEFTKHDFTIVKIQCVGPATLVYNGYDEKEAIQRAHTHLLGITKGLHAEEIILFLDEPVLEMVSFDKSRFRLSESALRKRGLLSVDYRKLWKRLFTALEAKPGLHNVTLGIHTCGNMDWNQLFALDIIKIISFDASKYGRRFIQSSGYRSDKRIAWGIDERSDVIDFQEGDLLTPPCGMNPPGYSVKDCEIKLRQLKETFRAL
ncbi:hypothetical protein KJA15_03060 [Patescibacteria group bacterium]|nr:hypothetical protein [Patescibacteria group bacterium]